MVEFAEANDRAYGSGLFTVARDNFLTPIRRVPISKIVLRRTAHPIGEQHDAIVSRPDAQIDLDEKFPTMRLILSAGLFVVAALTGCAPEQEASTSRGSQFSAQNDATSLSSESLNSLSNDYRSFLNRFAGIPDFIASSPLQALAIGTFLNSQREIGGPTGIVPIEAENFGSFQDLLFDYELDASEIANVDTSRLGILPFPAFVAGFSNTASRSSESRVVAYSMSIENIRLSKMTSSNLNDYLANELGNNASADGLVYGVYVADVSLSFSILDEDGKQQRVTRGMISENLGGADDIQISRAAREGYSSAIEGTMPVIIGYLVRELSPGSTSPTNIRVEETDRGTLSVRWDRVRDAAYYNLYWGSSRPNQIPPTQSEVAEGRVFSRPINAATSTEIPIVSGEPRYYIAITAVVLGQESRPSDIRIYDLDGHLSASEFGPGLPEPYENAPIVSKNSGNTRFDFYGCNKDIASVDCFLRVTNTGVEADVVINSRSTVIFDDSSEQYAVDRDGVDFGNNQGNSMYLLSNITVELRLRFSPVLPTLEFLPILRIVHSNDRVNGTVEFSRIDFFARR